MGIHCFARSLEAVWGNTRVRRKNGSVDKCEHREKFNLLSGKVCFEQYIRTMGTDGMIEPLEVVSRSFTANTVCFGYSYINQYLEFARQRFNALQTV